MAIETYAINAAQVVNMTLTAFAVPLLLGTVQYGKYAAVYAVPGFVQSMLEAFAMLALTQFDSNLKFWFFYTGLSLISSIIFMVFYSYYFDPSVAFWALVLGVGLLFRSAANALIYTNIQSRVVKINIVAETLTFCIYAIVLSVAYFSSFQSYTVPIMMVAGGSLLAGFYIILAGNALPAPKRPSVGTALLSRETIRLLLSRTYEDFTLTLMPLFVARGFGLAAAGEFRLIVSLIKLLSKTFPFRYELVIRFIKMGEFSFRMFLKISMVFVVFGLGLSVLLFFTRGIVFLRAETAMWMIALSSGMLVASLAAFPAAALFTSGALIVSTMFSLITFFLAYYGNMTGFLIMFTVANVVTFIASLWAIRSIEVENPIWSGA